MSRFNLSFEGEVAAGFDEADVMVALARRFPNRLPKSALSSGESVVLQSDLDRRQAASLYAKVSALGAVVKLSKVSSEPPPPTTEVTKEKELPPRTQMWATSQRAPTEAKKLAPQKLEANRSESQKARAKTALSKTDSRKPDPLKKSPAKAPTTKTSTPKPASQQTTKSSSRKSRDKAAGKKTANQLAPKVAVPKAKPPRRRSNRSCWDGRKQFNRLRQLLGQGLSQLSQLLSMPRPRRSVVKPRAKAKRNTAQSLFPGAYRSDTLQLLLAKPNVFQLTPFRNSSHLQQRSSGAQGTMRGALIVATCAAIALLLLSYRYSQTPSIEQARGIAAAAVDENGNLLIASGEWLFSNDRAGVGSGEIALASLGLQTPQAPLVLRPDGQLLLHARALLDQDAARSSAAEAEAVSTEGEIPLQLFHCTLTQLQCQIIRDATAPPVLAMTDSAEQYFALLALPERLVEWDETGNILQQANAEAASPASLQYRDGLLYLNSSEAPAISVLRPDRQAFGSQLDEILILPPNPALDESSRVIDFAWVADAWWLLLAHGDQSRSLHRYDERWALLSSPPLPTDFTPQELLPWGEKVLLRDPTKFDLQRFNQHGEIEVPLKFPELDAKLAQQSADIARGENLWQLSLLLLATIAGSALAVAYLQYLRSLAYKRSNLQGAEPIDGRAKDIHWLGHNSVLALRYRQITAVYIALGLLSLAALITHQASAAALSALLLLLTGPMLALLLLQRAPRSYIGTMGDEVLLVDHRQHYNHGREARIRYCHHFLIVDDTVVYTGNALLPQFHRDQFAQQIAAMARCGVGVDRKTVGVLLFESRHPLAWAALIVAVFSLSAIAALLLGT